MGPALRHGQGGGLGRRRNSPALLLPRVPPARPGPGSGPRSAPALPAPQDKLSTPSGPGLVPPRLQPRRPSTPLAATPSPGSDAAGPAPATASRCPSHNGLPVLRTAPRLTDSGRDQSQTPPEELSQWGLWAGLASRYIRGGGLKACSDGAVRSPLLAWWNCVTSSHCVMASRELLCHCLTSPCHDSRDVISQQFRVMTDCGACPAAGSSQLWQAGEALGEAKARPG